jgi:hypothetical protein
MSLPATWWLLSTEGPPMTGERDNPHLRRCGLTHGLTRWFVLCGPGLARMSQCQLEGMWRSEAVPPMSSCGDLILMSQLEQRKNQKIEFDMKFPPGKHDFVFPRTPKAKSKAGLRRRRRRFHMSPGAGVGTLKGPLCLRWGRPGTGHMPEQVLGGKFLEGTHCRPCLVTEGLSYPDFIGLGAAEGLEDDSGERPSCFLPILGMLVHRDQPPVRTNIGKSRDGCCDDENKFHYLRSNLILVQGEVSRSM